MEIRAYDMLTPLRIGSLDVLSKSEGSVPCKTEIQNTAVIAYAVHAMHSYFEKLKNLPVSRAKHYDLCRLAR